jgi:hypothetical protein
LNRLDRHIRRTTGKPDRQPRTYDYSEHASPLGWPSQPPLHDEMTCELLRALTQAKSASAKTETQPMVIYFYRHIKIDRLKRWVCLMTEKVL